MKKTQIIKLHNNEICLVSPQDFQYLSQFRWHLSTGGYPQRAIRMGNKVTKIKIHTDILGNPPIGLEPDHINRNKLDNRRENLRFVTRRENLFNRESKKCRGTTFNKQMGKWKVQIRIEGKRLFFGYFDTAEEAGKIYLEKKGKYLYATT